MLKDSTHGPVCHRIMVSERIKIMKAWLDGEKVQYRRAVYGEWVDVDEKFQPTFNFDMYVYRIKPKRKTFVPWHNVNEAWKFALTTPEGSVALYKEDPRQPIHTRRVVLSHEVMAMFGVFADEAEHGLLSLVSRPL